MRLLGSVLPRGREPSPPAYVDPGSPMTRIHVGRYIPARRTRPASPTRPVQHICLAQRTRPASPTRPAEGLR
jgi:hypothetical protein